MDGPPLPGKLPPGGGVGRAAPCRRPRRRRLGAVLRGTPRPACARRRLQMAKIAVLTTRIAPLRTPVPETLRKTPGRAWRPPAYSAVCAQFRPSSVVKPCFLANLRPSSARCSDASPQPSPQAPREDRSRERARNSAFSAPIRRGAAYTSEEPLRRYRETDKVRDTQPNLTTSAPSSVTGAFLRPEPRRRANTAQRACGMRHMRKQGRAVARRREGKRLERDIR